MGIIYYKRLLRYGLRLLFYERIDTIWIVDFFHIDYCRDCLVEYVHSYLCLPGLVLIIRVDTVGNDLYLKY